MAIGTVMSIMMATVALSLPAYSIMSTPGLVVDEKVLVYGRVPKPEEIKTLLSTAQQA